MNSQSYIYKPDNRPSFYC